MQFVTPKEVTDILLPNDKVLVSALEADDKTYGGLHLDPRHYDKYKKGVVISIGPGKLTEDETKRIPMQLAIGDVVLFDVTIAKEITINAAKFKIFNED